MRAVLSVLGQLLSRAKATALVSWEDWAIFLQHVRTEVWEARAAGAWEASNASIKSAENADRPENRARLLPSAGTRVLRRWFAEWLGIDRIKSPRGSERDISCKPLNPLAPATVLARGNCAGPTRLEAPPSRYMPVLYTRPPNFSLERALDGRFRCSRPAATDNLSPGASCHPTITDSRPVQGSISCRRNGRWTLLI